MIRESDYRVSINQLLVAANNMGVEEVGGAHFII